MFCCGCVHECQTCATHGASIVPSALTPQGMLEGVLDVSWTCDQASVLGAGNDKSIRVWDPTTGRVRHTMTGHTGKVGV